MLPMNKLVEDVAKFVREREEDKSENPAIGVDVRKQRDDTVLFANDLSEKYKELVSVELVDDLIRSYLDSIDKQKDERSE